MKKVNIYFHGKCFDGALSAAIFTMFYKNKIENAEFNYYPMIHKPNFNYDSLRINENEENVVLDLPYPGADKVIWWFDHHQSAFKDNNKRKEYDQQRVQKNLFWNSAAFSNTNFMFKILNNKFGFELPENQHHILKWVDTIDGARFESPDIPSELVEIAPTFAVLLEHDDNYECSNKFIEDIVNGKSCEDMSMDAYWSLKLNKIRQKNWDMIEDIKKLISVEKNVAFVDLRNISLSGYNKFIPYYLEPKIHYAVTLLKMPEKIKFSIGANPWSDFARSSEGVDIGSLCEKYGGGGHYSVGAISLKPDYPDVQVEKILKEILKILTDNVIQKHTTFKNLLLEQE